MNTILKLFFKTLANIVLELAFALKIDLLVNQNKLIILMYHGVTDRRIPRGSVENYDGKHVFVKKFEQQIKILSKRYTIISLQQLNNAILNRKKLPKNSLMITFDDGYKNNYHVAFPVLKKYGVPATIFVCPALVGKKTPNWPDTIEFIIANTTRDKVRINYQKTVQKFSLTTPAEKIKSITAIKKMLFRLNTHERNEIIKYLLHKSKVERKYSGNYLLMNWREITDLSKDTISIQSHSLTHPILTSEPSENAEFEITQSKKIIEQKTGKSVLAFAYPNGIFNYTVKELVNKADYTCAFGVQGKKNISLTNRFALKRIPVTNNYNNTIFFMNFIFNFNNLLFKLRTWLR